MTIDEAIKREKEKSEHAKEEHLMLQGEIWADIETYEKRLKNCVNFIEYHEQVADWLTELKELRALNQPQIDELVHGQEVEVPKLTDEEVNELLSTLNPNEVTTMCEFESENGNCLINECMFEPHRLCDKVRLNIYKELENDLKNSVNLELYELGRKDAIDDVIDKCSKEYQAISNDTVCKIWLSDIEQLKERQNE